MIDYVQLNKKGLDEDGQTKQIPREPVFGANRRFAVAGLIPSEPECPTASLSRLLPFARVKG